jgi:hypothetical protein
LFDIAHVRMKGLCPLRVKKKDTFARFICEKLRDDRACDRVPDP